jgi:phospholipase D1/2
LHFPIASMTIFQPPKNCWQVTAAAHATPLVDCANFYRALHRAICQAQHSIFIVGWELDSTVRLLRGKEESAGEAPSVASELLAWKALRNPKIKIYLLRWESSLAFVDERELMAEITWASKTPENVHICLDNIVPMGGSQHQKIVLIDDELSFSGGMDIARQRWDERDHLPDQPERTDRSGPYGPYHDVQIMMDGPIAFHLAHLVRWRWQRAAGYQALPLRIFSQTGEKPVPSWPKNWPILFENMDCAIARTLPQMEDHEEVHEIRQMYLDLIPQAENFIYIENQFVTYKPIAEALNQQLKAKPHLQVLLVSSFNPQGIFESKALWTGRIEFKKILYNGIEPSRVKMVFTKIDDNSGKAFCKRIHAKVLTIDDRYLIIGSANINNRSMSLDSECDIVFFAADSEKQKKITLFRNDLIGEHAGRTAEEIAAIFTLEKPLEELMKPAAANRYCFEEINDSQFINQSFQAVAKKFADPDEPLAPLRNPKKNLFLIGSIILVFAIFISAFLLNRRNQWLSIESIQMFLDTSRHSKWAFPVVCLAYVIGGFVLFPVTVLSLLTAATFGAFWGTIYATGGALASGALMFGIGHLAGFRVLRRLLGERIRKLDYHMREAGILGIALIRFLPLAPYSLVNLAAGMSSVRFVDFMLGSLLGFLPTLAIKGFVGDAILQSMIKPTPRTTIYLIFGVLAWLLVAYFSFWFAKKWRGRLSRET